MKISPIIVTACFALALTTHAYAHANGKSFEVPVGESIVDVGYDADTLVAGSTVRFDFNLLDQEKVDAPFTSVWVRLSQGNRTIIAGGLGRPSIGRTGITFNLPSAGSYDLYTRFDHDGQAGVEATIPLQVVPGAETTTNRQAPRVSVWWLLTVVPVAGAAFYLGTRRA